MAGEWIMAWIIRELYDHNVDLILMFELIFFSGS